MTPANSFLYFQIEIKSVFYSNFELLSKNRDGSFPNLRQYIAGTSVHGIKFAIVLLTRWPAIRPCDTLLGEEPVFR